MKRIIYILIVCLLFFDFSCKEDKNKAISTKKSDEDKKAALPYIIDIEKSIDDTKISLKISDYMQGISYIPLETTNNCLLGENIKVQITDQYILVNDHRALYQFNRLGKFIRQIGKRGKGPGEYNTVLGAVADSMGEVYVVPNPSRNIHVFSLNSGNYIRTIANPSNSSISLIPFPRNSLTFHVGNTTRKVDPDPNSLYLVDKSGYVLDTIPNSCKREKGNVSGDLVNMYVKKNHLFYMSFLTDTLYKVTQNKKRSPYAIFHLGKYRFDPETILLPETMKKYNEQLILVKLLETQNNFFLEFMKGVEAKSTLLALYNKQDKKIYMLPETVNEEYSGLINDIDGGLPFWPKLTVNDSLLVDCQNAFHIKNYYAQHSDKGNFKSSFKNVAKQLKENDNPVLIITKIRNRD